MRYVTGLTALAVLLAASGTGWSATVNGAEAQLDMRATLTLSNGLQMTFVPGHGMNGADAYVYTDVGGLVEEDSQFLGTWPDDTSPWSASASTSHGQAHGSVTVNTPGFDYSIHADALVEGLNVGDLGVALSDGYAWPDWLHTLAPGTATLTVEYSYTLDARDTCDNAEAYVYMNLFLADHRGTNYLTATGNWTIGYGSNPNTTIVEYYDAVAAGGYVTVSDSVSWAVDIPSTAEPYSWWSTWNYGEAGVAVEPIPEPVTMLGVMLGVGGLAGYVRRRRGA